MSVAAVLAPVLAAVACVVTLLLVWPVPGGRVRWLPSRSVAGVETAQTGPPWWRVAVAMPARLLGRRRARALRTARTERAREACSVLAEELRAGRDPGTALRCAAGTCPELEPVVQAYDLGADVPAALRRTGVPALVRVAGAWQVAHTSGRGLAETLRAVSGDLRREQATRRVVVAELASARATARLLVALPGVALVVATLGGAEPWRFFLGGLGMVCAAVGGVLLVVGLLWIERIADSVEARA